MKLEALPDNFLFQQSLKIFDPQKTGKRHSKQLGPHFFQNLKNRFLDLFCADRKPDLLPIIREIKLI